jgi:hypothetical protein
MMNSLSSISFPLLIALTILTYIVTGIACTGETDTEKENELEHILKSKGAIQTVIERRTLLSTSYETPSYDDWEYCYRETFDRHGNILEDYWCDEMRGLDIEYIFDDAGNIIESKWYDGSQLIVTHVYKYDSERVIEKVSYGETYFLPADKETKTTFEYDKSGNLVEAVTSNVGGQLIGKWSGKYDGEGNLIESVSYDSEGFLRSRILHKYDDRGCKVESIYYDSEQSLKRRETYQYDDTGNAIEYTGYYLDDPLLDGSLVVHAIIECLEFDENGNWTKCILTEKHQKDLTEDDEQYVQYECSRTITYYDCLIENDD